jgi:quercetin dioxygenase-like cupin family protein
MSVTIVVPADRDMNPVADDSPILLRRITDGLDGEPSVHVTEVPAHHHIGAHSHSETEVMIILGGTATVGDTVCPAGTLIVIPANERYAVDAGDEPLTFAVVRPKKASYEFAAQ